jgi:hypothetical protein
MIKMTEAKSVGISKSVFIVGLVAAILASSLISVAAVTQLPMAKGPKGEKGDTGATGVQGPTGATGRQGPRGFGTPDYDSGWTNIQAGQTLTFTHSLGTTDVYVYLVGKDAAGLMHQLDYGWDTAGVLHYGAAWLGLDATSIKVNRAGNDGNWIQVRVMMWIIS